MWRRSAGTTASKATTRRLRSSRFGLEYDFIIRNKLTWIDNLISGSGQGSRLAGASELPLCRISRATCARWVESKCEANSIVVVPEMGRRLCERAVLSYLGNDAEERFDAKTETARQRIDEVLESTGAGKLIRRAVKALVPR
jgi:hypothetical protein